MANHRADRGGSRRAPSAGTATRSMRLTRSASPATQQGKRAARPTTTPLVQTTTTPVSTPVVPLVSPAPTTPVKVAPATRAAAPAGGRRKAPVRKAAPAVRTSAARGPMFMGLPSLPVVAGVAALAVSAGGAISASQMPMDGAGTTLTAGTSLSAVVPGALADGADATDRADETAAALLEDREELVTRDSRREAQQEKTQAQLLAEAEAAAAARGETLQTLTVQAEKQAEKIEANLWVMPLSGYRLSATYGLSSSLWSSVHTGLDFAAPSGTPLKAVANGTVTEVGYDGSYGNKIVLTLEDGTEVWYCHLSSFGVSVGDKVTGGDYLGGVGSTGNSTGSHLHLEIRPGGGGPVDPYSALLAHGLQP